MCKSKQAVTLQLQFSCLMHVNGKRISSPWATSKMFSQIWHGECNTIKNVPQLSPCPFPILVPSANVGVVG